LADSLTLQGRQALPLVYNDRVFHQLTLNNCLGATQAERLFLLHDARRILVPGGIMNLTGLSDRDNSKLQNMAKQLGMQRVTGALSQAAINVDADLRLRKRDRVLSVLPSVSITIPAYSPRFFEQSLASAVAQTYPNLEIIVCDDSEQVDIEHITQRLAHTRPIRYVRNQPRLKARRNYAKCFDLAQGEFIKYLNDDDVLMPDCVESMIKAFQTAPDSVLVTSYRPRIDENGAFIPDQPATRSLFSRDMIINGASLANVMIMAGLNIVGEPTTTMFRKSDLDWAMPDGFRFENDCNIGVIDMMMWLPLLLQGDAVYLSRGLSHFRIHAAQQQHEPWIKAPTIENIRTLQSTWLALGMHYYLQRDRLLAKPLAESTTTWQHHPANPLAQPLSGQSWRFC
jgi:hypothetical protein